MAPTANNSYPFGAPGIPPRWTSISKEGIGTAYSSSSRVWFTLSHGILNEIYYPTIDCPQIRDMQFLITDGETFFHEEKRDLTSEISYIQRDSLGYRVVGTDPEGRYRLIKEIIADPHQPCVLMQVEIKPAPKWAGSLQIYALLAPHIGGGGWGNSAQRHNVAGTNLLVAWKERTYLAMGSSTAFLRTSCGYVGFSDGCQDLSQDRRLDWEFDRADDGNIAVIGQVDLSKTNRFVLGIAFGDSFHATVSSLLQSFSVPFGTLTASAARTWRSGSPFDR
ncbi:MAG: hypothetical protein HY649_12505 [Acidobacteria bacterium]|nr:hypothetical protein [Acidobacteriota bacterium]